MTDALDVDRYLEKGLIGLDQAVLLTVTTLAEHNHISVPEMAAELIRDGISARATRRTREHRCAPGEINPRFCRICSKPVEGTS